MKELYKTTATVDGIDAYENQSTYYLNLNSNRILVKATMNDDRTMDLNIQVYDSRADDIPFTVNQDGEY